MRRITIAIPFTWVKELIWQVAFWIAAYFVLITTFASSSEWQRIDHIYTSIFMLTLMMAVAVNSRVILPKFLNQKQYPLFFVLAALNIVGFAFFNHTLFDGIIDHILPGYYFISYYNIPDLLIFFAVTITATTLLHLSLEWFSLQETRHRLMAIEKEKVAAELRALTNQVNPHFLFNSLTVLYSLSLKHSTETSDAIVRLSDILRYVIYESTQGFVSLKSEVILIRNYIGLQRYRVNPAMKINFAAEVINEDLKVAPMLFLPLIENGFKHGVEGVSGPSFLDIRLQTEGQVVTFVIKNSRTAEADNSKTDGGIGLKNIRERLQLLYNDHHDFRITETEFDFEVVMKLETMA